MSFLISDQSLDVKAVESVLSDPECGGIVLFIGNVRNSTANKNVVALEFEVYEPMAILELEKIRDEIFSRWNVKHVALHHRKGRVAVGESAVIAGISAPHRADAFEACAYLMNRLKEVVPIWKKEIFDHGEVWVTPHA